MKYLMMFLAFGLLMACTEEEETKKTVVLEDEVLTEIKDGVFKEYYPGKKVVKFEGPQDPEGRRHGIWYFYNEKGAMISMTEFRHGKKNGVSLHKYPNGAVQYTGEYEDDKQVGVWRTFDPNGALKDSVNYDVLNEKLK